MWQLLYQCAFLKKHQNWWIFVRHFNTEDGRKKHFQHIMLYYIKKGKNATEAHTQKVCAVYEEGAVTD